MSDRLTRPIVWAVGLLGVFAVVGAAAGWLWRSRLHIPHGVVVSHRWYPNAWDTGERSFFAATGWYVVIALVAGLVLGLLAAWLSRAPELLTLAAVLVGALVAAWLMLVVGLHGAPPDPQIAAARAADGTHLSGTISRPGTAAFVVWPLAALVPLGAVYLIFPDSRSARSSIDG